MKSGRLLTRHVFNLAVILSTLLALTACDPDDDYYYDPPIVGGWQLIAPSTIGYNEFYFYPDGSGTYYVDDYYGEDSYYIEWDIYGQQLTVYFPDQGDTMYFSWAVRGATLYLYPSGGGEPWVYQAC